MGNVWSMLSTWNEVYNQFKWDLETSWSINLILIVRSWGLNCDCCWQDDLRLDGRRCEDYRHMEIETDVVSNTDGSAKISLVSWIKQFVIITYSALPVFVWCCVCLTGSHWCSRRSKGRDWETQTHGTRWRLSGVLCGLVSV